MNVAIDTSSVIIVFIDVNVNVTIGIASVLTIAIQVRTTMMLCELRNICDLLL